MFSVIAVMAFSVSCVGNTSLIDEKINAIVFEKIEIQEDENNERYFLRGIATSCQSLTAGHTEQEAIIYINISAAICLGWSLSDVRL